MEESSRPQLRPLRKIIYAALAVITLLACVEGVARIWLSLDSREIAVTPIADGSTQTGWMPMLIEDVGTPDAGDLYIEDANLFWALRPATRSGHLLNGSVARRCSTPWGRLHPTAPHPHHSLPTRYGHDASTICDD